MKKLTSKYNFLTEPLQDFEKAGNTLFQKSIEILTKSQLSSGGTTASLPGTRYAGHVYPRDHGFATRAFIQAKELEKAEDALDYILRCEVDANGVMFQRYDESGKNASYKPPQIDGNAQSLLSLASFTIEINNKDLLNENIKHVDNLLKGIQSQTSHFSNGSLVFSINGIIEYSPFERGYDLYTNAVCYRALKEIGLLTNDTALQNMADKIKAGINAYLYYPSLKTYIPCLRREPDVSYVLLANPKNFLALSDFDVFDPNDKKFQQGLTYHLEGTINHELGAYNRYHFLMDRHNFGNGPWPMVMLRLAQYYIKAGDKEKAKDCFTWVINIAKNNLDHPNALAEHVSTKESFLEEYEAFLRINDTAPRPAKKTEYETIKESKTFKELGLAYAVNPLVWSHAQFILAWKDMQK